MEVIIYAVIAFSALTAGTTGGYFLRLKALRGKGQRMLRDAEAEAEVIKKDKMLQAKEKFLQLKAEHEKYINDKNARIIAADNRLKQRDVAMNQRKEELTKKQKEIETAKKETDAIRANLTLQMKQRTSPNLILVFFPLFG